MVLGGKNFSITIFSKYTLCVALRHTAIGGYLKIVFIMKRIFKSTSYYEKIGLNVARFVFCVTAMFPYWSSWAAHSSKTSFNTLGVY